MRRLTNRQRRLPFGDESTLQKLVSQENRDRCRTLLARLLARIITAEAEERSIDECREDPVEPS
jgi:phosphopantetheinyl transferase